MLPNLAPLIQASTALLAIIGSNPVRFYRHGSAPQDVVAPYVTHRTLSLPPVNDMSGTPRADIGRVQLSCWSDNTGTGSLGVETLASALRDAVEPRWYVLDVRDMGRDPETMRYRIDIDVQVFVHRQASPSS